MLIDAKKCRVNRVNFVDRNAKKETNSLFFFLVSFFLGSQKTIDFKVKKCSLK